METIYQRKKVRLKNSRRIRQFKDIATVKKYSLILKDKIRIVIKEKGNECFPRNGLRKNEGISVVRERQDNSV